MRKKILKKIGIITVLSFTFLSIVNAAETVNDLEVDGFNIMKELREDEISLIDQKIDEIGKAVSGKVMETYYQASTGLTTSQQVASGIMNWDTIMNYLVFIVQFLSQLGLVVGAVFIMYAGYKYTVSLFNGGKTPSSTVKNAIIGILIVIFSYAIMKILTSFIGLS